MIDGEITQAHGVDRRRTNLRRPFGHVIITYQAEKEGVLVRASHVLLRGALSLLVSGGLLGAGCKNGGSSGEGKTAVVVTITSSAPLEEVVLRLSTQDG